MKKFIKYVLIIALIALVALQFFRPEKNQAGYESIAAFESDTNSTPKIASILKENCYDCHSNQTEYPWYSEIAPFSLWLDDHIEEGKHHFNVSAWEEYSVKKKDHKLKEFQEMVEENEMPLDSYTWLHGNLSNDDKELLLQWVSLTRLQYINQLEVSSN